MHLMCARCAAPATHSAMSALDSERRFVFCEKHARWGVRPLPRIRPAMWVILGVLNHRDRVTLAELVEMLAPDFSFGTIRGPVKRLVTAGMVQRATEGQPRYLTLTLFGVHICQWVR